MTNQEFQLWWDHAVVVIPSLADWLGKIKKQGKAMTDRGMKPDKDWAEIIRFWEKRLKHVDLTVAKDAIEKLAQDDMPKYNRDYEGIPFAISRMCSEPATMSPSRHFVDGEQTVKCRECDDEGLLMIWDQKCVDAMRNGEFEKTPHYDRAIRCTCEAQNLWSKKFAVYDPSRDCLCSNHGDVADVEALREFCKPANRAKEMAGYDPSLAAYNREPF